MRISVTAAGRCCWSTRADSTPSSGSSAGTSTATPSWAPTAGSCCGSPGSTWAARTPSSSGPGAPWSAVVGDPPPVDHGRPATDTRELGASSGKTPMINGESGARRRVRRAGSAGLAGQRLVVRIGVDPGLFALGLGDRRGSTGQRVVAGTGLREGDDLADRLDPGEQRGQPVPADRGAGVRRGAVREGVQEEAEPLPGLVT